MIWKVVGWAKTIEERGNKMDKGKRNNNEMGKGNGDKEEQKTTRCTREMAIPLFSNFCSPCSSCVVTAQSISMLFILGWM